MRLAARSSSPCARARRSAAPRSPALVDEVGDLAGQPLGRDPQLDDRARLEQAPVGQLLGQHAGVGERVDGSRRWPITSVGGLDPAALAAVAARCGRRTGPGARRRPAPGPGARCRARCRAATAAAAPARAPAWTSAHHRLAEAQRDHQRREGERAAEQRVVEHRHLDHHAAQPLGRQRGRLERGVGAQRGAAARPPRRPRGGRAARSPARRRTSSSSTTCRAGGRSCRGRAGRA